METQQEGTPLTPQVFARIWSELFCGLGVFSNKVIRTAVLAEHLKMGGMPPAEPLANVQKRAKKWLHHYQPGFANWAVGPYVAVAGRGARSGRYATDSLQDLQDLCSSVPRGRYEGAKDEGIDHPVYGEGEGAVYLYYYPSQKVDAESKNLNSWPCKIGQTSGDVKDRIMDQFGTSRHELPAIAWEHRTDEYVDVEKRALKLLPSIPEQKTGKGIGREWRLANPDLALLVVQALDDQASEDPETV